MSLSGDERQGESRTSAALVARRASCASHCVDPKEVVLVASLAGSWRRADHAVLERAHFALIGVGVELVVVVSIAEVADRKVCASEAAVERTGFAVP